ncbi:MAG: phosphoglucosamine mutase [Bacteroidales bacterium]|nr:phosphoglucosamine mutase [Bacteroidales bacterium]
MTLIKSISGIRGTIGDRIGEDLTPTDIKRFSAAFGTWINNKSKSGKYKIVIGRDARTSGEKVSSMVSDTLRKLNIDVVDLGLSTTPTVEIAVTGLNANAGIIITASHNPEQWNALKLLNEKGEFISADEGAEVIDIAEKGSFEIENKNKNEIGNYIADETWIKKHIDKILILPLVDINAIEKAEFRIVIDCINSTGGIALPLLLKALKVKEIIELNCEPTGKFAHNPEPLPEHLTEISKVVKEKNANLGFVVDPDVDRLAIVCEDGSMFGEEYTLVAVADYILKNKKGNTVSNLSSTMALKEITENHGCGYFSSAVGEVNVVDVMKKNNSIIGGEGNGGIIYPELHYGRDALVGIALFLTHLAKENVSCKTLRNKYPDYFISKNKIELTPGIDVDKILREVQKKYKTQKITTIDGVKIEFEKEWVHLRKSNTEPIIRIYCESFTALKVKQLAIKIIDAVKEMI